MTVPVLVKGLKEGMNVGADFASTIGALGIQSNPNPLATSFDLDDLDEHNFPIEHDGSLSRADAYSGDDHTFNQAIFDQILQFYSGMDTATIPVASKARYQRIKNARAINPDFTYGPREIVLSYGETSLYLSVMGDPISGKAPVDYVKSLFGMSSSSQILADSMRVQRTSGYLTSKGGQNQSSQRLWRLLAL